MAYADRLQSEYDEISAGINDLMERAAAENRDLTDDENSQIERDDKRRGDLEKAPSTTPSVEERDQRVSQMRARVPRAADGAAHQPGARRPGGADPARDRGHR